MREYISQETKEFIHQKSDFSDFLEKVHYSQLEFSKSENYRDLAKQIKEIKKAESQIIIYLSIAPEYFGAFIDHASYLDLDPQTKIVFEKPFGVDLQTAQELNNKIMSVFDEEQIYRIDHYVGKEAIQNILAFRFANSIFEPIWNNHYIDNVQITASESIGIETRGPYYESSGALRDMMQNHLFQVMALIGMEAPAQLDALSIQREKTKVMQSVKAFSNFDEEVIFGQYEGYLQEPGVAPDSRTETFVALKLQIDNWRMSGIPIYLKTGKALDQKITQVVIEFKSIPHILYQKNQTVEKNRIILEVQPDESIHIHFNIKENGVSHKVKSIKSKFEKCENSKEAYEKLLEDVILGDKTLFTSFEFLQASWEIVDKLIHCKNNCPLIHRYPQGSTGPEAFDQLLLSDNIQRYAANQN